MKPQVNTCYMDIQTGQQNYLKMKKTQGKKNLQISKHKKNRVSIIIYLLDLV